MTNKNSEGKMYRDAIHIAIQTSSKYSNHILAQVYDNVA